MSTYLIEPPDEQCTSREAVRKDIHDNAVFSTALLTMNALATVVACYGLLEDSAAVVIGAMVIATLLGPITGIALALVDGDNGLLRKALLAEASGVVLVLCMALLIGVIHRDAPLTREILARTRPTLLDVIIALAGGAAGAYASASPRLSAGLVGVAIATALVPPLSACGICLGRGEASLGFPYHPDTPSDSQRVSPRTTSTRRERADRGRSLARKGIDVPPGEKGWNRATVSRLAQKPAVQVAPGRRRCRPAVSRDR